MKRPDLSEVFTFSPMTGHAPYGDASIAIALATRWAGSAVS